MDNLTKEQRHKNMKNIKSKNTKIEVKLRKALYHKGIRYRMDYKELPGKPDIAITKYKIAVFCDGEFFHGYDWNNQKERLAKSNNSDYWLKKIKRNMERDIEVNIQLEEMGWTVLRFWGKQINKNLDSCVKEIEDVIFEKTIEEQYVEDDSDLFED